MHRRPKTRSVRFYSVLPAPMLAGLCLILSQGDGIADRLSGPAFAPVATPTSVSRRLWTAHNWFADSLTAGHSLYTVSPDPLALGSTPHGLLVGYTAGASAGSDITAGAHLQPAPDFILGVEGLTTSKIEESSPGDRLVEFDFGGLRTRAGRGMPFIYATTDGGNPTVTFNAEPVPFETGDPGKPNLIGVRLGTRRYGLFCPAQGNWTSSTIDTAPGGPPSIHTRYTCHLPLGHNYFSIALLPDEASFARFGELAFTFPAGTQTAWSYDQQHSEVKTTFTVQTEQKEGWLPEGSFLQALYPHQTRALASHAPPVRGTYRTSRGPMQLYQGTEFTTVDRFHGVLPFLPVPERFDTELERTLLQEAAEQDSAAAAARDTCTEGKSLLRLAQLLPLAQASGETALLEQFETTLRDRFALWSSPVLASDPRTRPRFVYNPAWGTLVGYPAPPARSAALNDHMHYGDWIQAAAVLGFYDHKWMARDDTRRFVGQLARDLANIDHADSTFPLLRHFDAFSGHSWPAGQGPFGNRENQDLGIAPAGAWAGMMLFAAETGDTRLRDAAIWMYTLETNAALETAYAPGGRVGGPPQTQLRPQPRPQIRTVSFTRLNGQPDRADGAALSPWSGETSSRLPARSLQVGQLSFTAASLYLGRDPEQVRRNVAGISASAETEATAGTAASSDLSEMYEALADPHAALSQWQHTHGNAAGESRAHEFAWMSSLEALGHVDPSVLADTPFYTVFRTPAGLVRHVVFNPAAEPVAVHFSDGHVEKAPANSLVSEGRVMTP